MRKLLKAVGAGLAALVVSSCAAVPAEGVTRSVEAYREVPGGTSKGSGVGEWWLPAGDDLPVVVLIHGGYWAKGYDRGLEDPVASALSAKGFAVFNIDYRPAGGAWSDSLEDVAAAVDSLARSAHADVLDLDRVALVGHSAGGHLALWGGSRERLPAGSPGADPVVIPSLVVAQAPVADLVLAEELGLGGGAVNALLQGGPDEVPGRYAVADPAQLVASSNPTSVLLHGGDDTTVPLSVSQSYVSAAQEVGARVRLREVSGGHFAHLDPESSAVAALLEELKTL